MDLRLPLILLRSSFNPSVVFLWFHEFSCLFSFMFVKKVLLFSFMENLFNVWMNNFRFRGYYSTFLNKHSSVNFKWYALFGIIHVIIKFISVFCMMLIICNCYMFKWTFPRNILTQTTSSVLICNHVWVIVLKSTWRSYMLVILVEHSFIETSVKRIYCLLHLHIF